MYCPVHPKMECICVEQIISFIHIKFCHKPLVEWILIQYKKDSITIGKILSPSILAQGVNTLPGKYYIFEGYHITCHEGTEERQKYSSIHTHL